MRTPSHMKPHHIDPNHRKGLSAPRMPTPPRHNDRTCFSCDTISIRGWPSRGGLIALRRVTALNYEFLGLDALNPSLYRDSDQNAEDEFCQRLLSLGAKWYDSLDRFKFIYAVEENEEREITALDMEEEGAHMPSAMECRWISVGYPSGEEEGGLWVAEYEISMYGMHDKKNYARDNVAQLLLAKTMDEKCAILKMLGGKFYASLENYNGFGCLKAWKEKTTGEFGPLVRTN